MIKLYVAAGLIAALGLAYWRYDYVVTQNNELKTQLEGIVGVLNAERKLSQDYANRALARQIEANKKDEELEKLHNCIADKSCVPRVRIKQACPTVPSSTTGTAGADGAPTGFAEISGSDYYRLVAAQKKAIWMIEGLQAEVEARSKPDFCNPR
jgi:ABC-type phosphate transport system auxiliary subunit